MRKWWRKASLSLLCAAAIESAAAGAAFGQVGIEPSHVSGSRYKIVVTGRIDAATLIEFSRAVIDPRIADTNAPSVELDSHGGSVLAAMAIGDLVRKAGFDTHVGHRHTCDSACVLILAAGVERHAAPGSVNIHRPKVAADQPPDRARARYGEAVASMRHYLRDMGMRDRLLDAMLAVPSGRLRTLSQGDMEEFGLAARSIATDTPGRQDVRPVPQINGRAETLAVRQRRKVDWARTFTPQQRLLRTIVAAGPPPGVWSAPDYDSRYSMPLVRQGKQAYRNARRTTDGLRHGSRKAPRVVRARPAARA